MDNQTRNLLAAATVGGYVLGRTKKGRIALTAATFLAGRGMGLDPRTLVVEGVRRISEIPQVVALQTQLRDESIEAGRNALTAIVNRSLHSLADAIGSRTAGLGLDGDDETAEKEEGRDEEAEEPPRRRPGSREADRSGAADLHSAKRQARRAAPRGAAPAETASSRKKAVKAFARNDRRR
jgi:hypothetical protein